MRPTLREPIHHERARSRKPGCFAKGPRGGLGHALDHVGSRPGLLYAGRQVSKEILRERSV